MENIHNFIHVYLYCFFYFIRKFVTLQHRFYFFYCFFTYLFRVLQKITKKKIYNIKEGIGYHII